MSLAQRAFLALVLMASFYLLALAVVGALLWIAYADVAYTEHPIWRFVLFCIVAAGSVMWAIVPRPDRFTPPGPRVRKMDEPQLFAVLEEVAKKTGQEMPAEVYFVNDVNAFVTSRGGIMGFGSHRVMGVGLPLLEAVTVQELKAILAHEFGHYHGGDVALGPWIHKTRMAIARTVQQLHENVLQFIFIWYGNLFLRVTHAVSRRQEFVADEVAARAAGAGVMISGLRTTHAAAFAFGTYWRNELTPVLQSGYLPPVHTGFARFMRNSGIGGMLDAVVQHEEQQGTTDPYDTHPSLRDRIAALAQFPKGSEGDTRRASALLTHIGNWERDVLGADTGPEWARELKPLEWEQVAEKVYLPMWRARVDHHAHLLKNLTIGTLLTTQADYVRLGSSLFTASDEGITDQDRFGRAMQLVIAGIALRLVALGWSADALPGEEVVLRCDGHELRPWSELSAVMEGRTTVEAWRQRYAALGLADLPLSGAASV